MLSFIRILLYITVPLNLNRLACNKVNRDINNNPTGYLALDINGLYYL